MSKTILHFSDIHFGGEQAPNRAEALLNEIEHHKPTVVAISGDLTQRARSNQFRQARAFIDRINRPVIVVPGNHDVPLWNLFDRFISPLEKYKRWISPDLNPIYMDDEMLVMGIDTTRSFTIKGGEINTDDLRAIKLRLCGMPGQLCKVLVAHHPLAHPPGFEQESPVGGLHRALKLFDECGVDLILTGHLHQSYIVHSRDLFPDLKQGLLLVQAGTAASLRGRGSEQMKNSFNHIEITGQEIKATNFIYSDEAHTFIAAGTFISARHHAGNTG